MNDLKVQPVSPIFLNHNRYNNQYKNKEQTKQKKNVQDQDDKSFELFLPRSIETDSETYIPIIRNLFNKYLS